MLRHTMGSLVLALSLSAAAFGTGCATAQTGEDVSSDEGAMTGAVVGAKANVETIEKTVDQPLVGATDKKTACTTTATLVQIKKSSLGNAAVEDKINASLASHANGDCEIEMTVELTQEVMFNGQGYLTVRSVANTFAGAHPEVSISFQNFRLSDGVELTAKDFFAADASTKVKALVIKALRVQVPDTEVDAVEQLATLEDVWGKDRDLDTIAIGFTATGMQVDMMSNYPHVIAALAPAVDLDWADLKPLLKSGTPILALAK